MPKKGDKKAGAVTYNPDGSFTITGELAEQVEACAASNGISIDDYVDLSIREFVSSL